MIFRQIPLYRFLQVCNERSVDKTVLDCGAGGNQPPLCLFDEYGYQTFGIDNEAQQIKNATEFAENRGQTLNIIKGDMRELPWQDESFGAVYAYNSIFHMRKDDIKRSVNEIIRVLKTGGVLYLNVLSVDDFMCGTGKTLGNDQYEQKENNSCVIHSYFTDQEADNYVEQQTLIYKEKRIISREYEGQFIKQAYIDYILQKKI